MTKQDWSVKDLKRKWERELSNEDAQGLPWLLLDRLVSDLSDDTKLPRERLAECIRTRDVSGLFAIADSLDVTAYTSADLLLQDRQVVELFSKFDFPNSPFDKRGKAKIRFFEAEERCREANARLRHWTDLNHRVNAVIHGAIRHIDRVLGSFDVSEMLTYSRFGPGASLCVKGQFTTEYFKLCEKRPTISSGALPYAEALFRYDHHWCAYLLGVRPMDVAGPFSPLEEVTKRLQITDHNKAAFVPKNAKTERSIAIEPYFNIYFQLGVGAMIRNRLYRRAGINLDSQERNQTLAKLGSLDGSVATIDFSMASDTIAREAVRALIRTDWFEHLDRLRSKTFVLEGGKSRPWMKFSSMGNGYTFELETLIFWSLAMSATELVGGDPTLVSVYGDDVILPTQAVDGFIEASTYLGFKTNDEKSFIKGPFRESCGEDFLEGTRVRPVFCKELWNVRHCASLANRLLALNRAVGDGSRLNRLCRGVVSLLYRRIPRDVRKLLVGPPSEEYDGYLHTDDVARLTASDLVRWNRHLYCWEYPVLRFRAARVKPRNAAAHELFALWSTASRRQPIPDRRAYLIEGLHRLSYKSAGLMSYFQEESIPREITPRNVGGLSLGTSRVWSLGDLIF